jgi:alkylated DNA nucleotide flippase Atl1
MGTKKTWTQKLNDSKGLPQIKRFDQNKPKTWPAGVYVIPAPVEVDSIMRQVPKGKVITIQHIRDILAQKHGVEYACPITTGIFSWIAAHAAQEQAEQGTKRVTPWWRTLKTGGLLNEKYPGGIEEHKNRLETEGHTVIRKGKSKHFIVKDFDKALAIP